ncbi:MAG: molybdopterin dinucleotide binding domain-containing protein, partial [Polyangiaceae bacterium]
MTRTGRSATLSAHIPEPYAEVHPDTAALHDLEHGALVRVLSEHGAMTVRAHVSSHQAPGAVFVPMHWTAALSSDGRVNAAVHGRVDPISAQPDFKATPVRIEPFEVAWYGFVITRRDLDLRHFAYWVRVQGDGVSRYEIAGSQTPDDFAVWARSFLCDDRAGSEWIEYLDAKQG